MANVINNKGNGKAFQPTVDNTVRNSNASGFGKFMWYLTFILIIPMFVHVALRNKLLKSQMRINETSGTIDIQLKQRRDTLIKLVDATKSYVKYEKGLLTDITKLRKSTFKASDDAKVNKLSGKILAVAEGYPKLQADNLAKELMEQAAYLERELAAARRLYNREVTWFNENIYVWPYNVISSSMKLNTFELFKASAEDKKDVDLKF